MSSCEFGNCSNGNSLNMNIMDDFSFPSSYGSDTEYSPFNNQMGQQMTRQTTQEVAKIIPTNQQTLTNPAEPIRSQMVNNPPQMGHNVPIYNPVNSLDINTERGLNSIKHTNILDLHTLGNKQPAHRMTTPSNHSDHSDHSDHKLSINTLREEVKGSLNDSYLLVMKNINMAFILIAAFAWNDAVKYYIARMIKLQKGTPYYYLYYALIVTLLAVLSVRLTHKFL